MDAGIAINSFGRGLGTPLCRGMSLCRVVRQNKSPFVIDVLFPPVRILLVILIMLGIAFRNSIAQAYQALLRLGSRQFRKIVFRIFNNFVIGFVFAHLKIPKNKFFRRIGTHHFGDWPKRTVNPYRSLPARGTLVQLVRVCNLWHRECKSDGFYG